MEEPTEIFTRGGPDGADNRGQSMVGDLVMDGMPAVERLTARIAQARLM